MMAWVSICIFASLPSEQIGYVFAWIARLETERIHADFPARRPHDRLLLLSERPGKLSHGLLDHPLRRSIPGRAGQPAGRENVEYNAGDLPYGVDPDRSAIPACGARTRSGASRMRQLDGAQERQSKDPAYAALLEEALGEIAGVISR
jgi:hypothetical protein